ncbi:cyclic lactone autoinducer peptide [Ruminiclostridium josui]|nr:cyclic lactone autoinducer peptide [Ruminiclostridium josui]
MKSKIKLLLAPLSLLITFLALSGVSTACCSSYYQPKAPKHLTTRKSH